MRLDDWVSEQEEELQEKLNNGEITLQEYNKALRKIERDASYYESEE